MGQRSRAYVLVIMLLAGTALSAVSFLQPSYASHNNILQVEVDGTVYDQNDEVIITGSIDDLADNEDVVVKVSRPNGGSDSDDADLDEDTGDFSYIYEISGSAADGIYEVEVSYDDEKVYTYFIVDEDDDPVDVVVEDDTYQAGDDVDISGQVEDPATGVDEVEITVLDPTNDEVVNSADEDIDSSDEFSYTLELDSDAEHGRYAVIVTYNDEDKGYAIFDVEDEDNSGGSNDPITVTLSKSTYAPGATVQLDGEVDDYESGEDAQITVDNSENDEIVDESVEVETDGSFEFEFELDDDAQEGEYTITIVYNGDDIEVTFDVSETASGGSSSSSGLTVKLDKSSYLAGDNMSITGKVPKTVKDAVVNIDLFDAKGNFAGMFATAEPTSSLAYTATIRLKSDLKVEKDYEVRVNYGTYEAEAKFSITGKSSGSSGGAITVKTDKKEYSLGSTVRISGTIASDSIIEGEKVLIRVNKPDGNPYRIDIVEPSASGSYTYNVVIGGALARAGQYDVVVTYNEKEVKTEFELGDSEGSKKKFNLKVEDKSFPIEYDISGGQIKSMFVKATDKKLVVSIDATEDGQLVLVLPRDVIDSVQDGSDKSYVVATADLEAGVGNENVQVRESETTDGARTLVIDYKAGTDLIEISGTTVVPEFPISMLVLAASIVAIIAVSARFQNKLGKGMMPWG